MYLVVEAAALECPSQWINNRPSTITRRQIDSHCCVAKELDKWRRAAKRDAMNPNKTRLPEGEWEYFIGECMRPIKSLGGHYFPNKTLAHLSMVVLEKALMVGLWLSLKKIRGEENLFNILDWNSWAAGWPSYPSIADWLCAIIKWYFGTYGQCVLIMQGINHKVNQCVSLSRCWPVKGAAAKTKWLPPPWLVGRGTYCQGDSETVRRLLQKNAVYFCGGNISTARLRRLAGPHPSY